MNTIAASTRRVPRAAQIGLVVLIAAFALLMVVRSGVLSGSDSSAPSVTAPPKTAVTPPPTSAVARQAERRAPPRPSLERGARAPLLQGGRGLALRRSGPRRPCLGHGGPRGARSTGAGFVAVNVGGDRTAAKVASFAGPVSTPTMLVVRRPGKIVTQIPGEVESVVVAQAARNAGARR